MNCLFAFNGDPMCFVHVLLNALDMEKKGHDPIIVFEGSSVTLIPKLEKKEHPFHSLYITAKEAGLIEGACQACSSKLGVLNAIKTANIPLIGDMAGHPAIANYQAKGYTVITF
ncbi:cytoplasmic protein [Pseudodesulfovibrio sp. JC047]|uniref:DsrE family protein n=1 Tax=Pseudodesulfovibrio sp. JC047 TaxID=2683199 RepID=UPI0013D11EE3|nr:DsrE family protein [Pseudodesulfovibrio sp. JC047]NDV18911.1 cytoplasmic protein [Pseudodesulfovibrio sp. JC047]